jgi:hypothetical protein
MKLNDFFIKKDEIIEWDRFLFLLKEINVPVVRNDDLISGNYDYSYEKLFIGGGDWEINSSNFKITPELKLMIGTNLNIEKNEKIIGMPIGMPSFSHDRVIGNLDKIIEKNESNKQYKNLCYCGFRDSTYQVERSFVRNLFENKDWVTSTIYDRTDDGHSNYIDNIFNHKFILCPRGNGIDTHRIWESLYLRSIPIVKKCVAMSHFYDLPILWIDDWDEITYDFLQEKYIEITNGDFNFEKLNLYYYINKFKEIDNE